ncbi:hypothetical protein PMAYCL1PPCAC_25700, partial [Pristionchus mayeri]
MRARFAQREEEWNREYSTREDSNAFEKRQDDTGEADFYLRCDVNHNGPWKCEAQAQLRPIEIDGSYDPYDTQSLSFNENSNFVVVDWQDWDMLTHDLYTINDSVVVEFNLCIVSAERGEPIV